MPRPDCIGNAHSADEVLAKLGRCVAYVKYEPVISLLPKTLRGVSSHDARFDLMNRVCHGSLSTVGGQTASAGNCLRVDKDGDRVFSYSRLAPAPGRLEFTAGTGKFSGIRGGGDYIAVPLPGIGSSRNSCPEAKFKSTLPD